jgi:hypothetical protein
VFLSLVTPCPDAHDHVETLHRWRVLRRYECFRLPKIIPSPHTGFYIPYIANRILTASATEKSILPLALQGLLINDGVYSSSITGEQAPIANFTVVNQKALGFSNSQVSSLTSKAASCGYTAMLNQIVRFSLFGLTRAYTDDSDRLTRPRGRSTCRTGTRTLSRTGATSSTRGTTPRRRRTRASTSTA